MTPPPSITLVGAGRLSYQLGLALHEAGAPIRQVFSRTDSKAQRLAKAVGAKAVTSLSKIDGNSDLYLLCVSDSAISEVATTLAQHLPSDCWVAHTSGASPSTLLAPHFPNYGVFYPLQSFSNNKRADFTQIPVCIYSSSEVLTTALRDLAGKISSRVYSVDDEQRTQLHLAAVFVNNFTNHLFHIGHEITAAADLPFDLLRPLIRETVEKLAHGSPAELQTGPAKRGDVVTMERHLRQLEAWPAEYRELYVLLSEGIGKRALRGRLLGKHQK